MQPVTDRVESEGICIMVVRSESIGKQRAKQLTALVAERIRVVGDVLAFVIEHGQSKIKMEKPRLDELKTDHLPAR